MSVDLELFETNVQNPEENAGREETSDQTLIDNTIQPSELGNETKRNKPESDGTMETDAEKESQEAKGN